MSMCVYGEGPGAQLLAMTKLFPEPGALPCPVSWFLGISGCGGGGDMMGLGTEGKGMWPQGGLPCPALPSLGGELGLWGRGRGLARAGLHRGYIHLSQADHEGGLW